EDIVVFHPGIGKPALGHRVRGPRMLGRDVEVAVGACVAALVTILTGPIPHLAAFLRTTDDVVLLAAFTAEGQRQQDMVRTFGHRDLVLRGEITLVLILYRRVYRVALRHELVQPESEQRP